MDRRSEERARKVFRAAYVRSDGLVHFAYLRNISHSGASFSGISSMKVGDLVSYCYEGPNLVDGVVRWTNGDQFGVENMVAGNSSQTDRNPYPYRSVRLPISYPVSIFIRGELYETSLYNLSISGACIANPGTLSKGMLLSVDIGNQLFPESTVKWVDSDRAGIRFARRLADTEISALTSRLQGLIEDEQKAKKVRSPSRVQATGY